MSLAIPIDMKELLRVHKENTDIFNEVLFMSNRILSNDITLAYRLCASELPKQLVKFADENDLNKEQ